MKRLPNDGADGVPVHGVRPAARYARVPDTIDRHCTSDGSRRRARATVVTAAAGRLADRRILLVEDDYLLADALAAALQEIGATLLGPLGNVQDTLALLASQVAIDAVVLDVNLVGERVDHVADIILARHIPVVFVSGYDRELLPPRFARIPHCLKPVDVNQLATALASQFDA